MQLWITGEGREPFSRRADRKVGCARVSGDVTQFGVSERLPRLGFFFEVRTQLRRRDQQVALVAARPQARIHGEDRPLAGVCGEGLDDALGGAGSSGYASALVANE